MRPPTFVRNLVAGDYPTLERLRRIAVNVGRRTKGTCCGHYGDPGC